MAEGVIKKIIAAELQQQVLDDNIEVYPVTATSAVFDSKTNQSLDDILSSINTRIIQAAASGGGGTIISAAGYTYVWAFAGFTGDSEAIADIQGKANNRGIPSGWQESSNVELQEGEMLYMTTARKQGDKWLTWTDGSIWSAPVRLGSSGTTSGTGSDGQGYNYIYCRTSTGDMPTLQEGIDHAAFINAVEEASKDGQGILVQEAGGTFVYTPLTEQTGVWYDHPDGVTATIPYEWILVYQGNEEEWVLLTPQPILWSKYGVNGQDGDGVEYVFCTIQDTDKAPVIIKNNTITGTVKGSIEEHTVLTVDTETGADNYYYKDKYYQQDDFIPDGWYDQPQEVNQLNPKQYVSIRKKKWVANEEKSKWGLFTEPKIWSEIPIVVSGLDKLSIDWSNNNVNVVTGESGASLQAATDNYLTVKLGDTLLPYSPTTFDSIDDNSYNISNVEITTGVDYELESYSDEEDVSAPALARFYITSLPGTQRLYTVKFTLKVRINGTIYTQYSTINVYVKDVAYELVVYPKGFNLSAIDTAAQEDLTVQVKMRNATTNRFLTGTEIKDLMGLPEDYFQYKFIKDNTTTEQFVDIITDENTTSDTFKIDCTSQDILNQCRAIEIKLTSSNGYEDSETVMIARDGNTGDEGNGLEYIFYLATEDIIWLTGDGADPNNPNYKNNPQNWKATQESEPILENSGWTDDLLEVTESNPVQYVSVRRFKRQDNGTKAWGTYEKPVVYNRWTPSPYSVSISNDSVIIDDNTDSVTLANASFCQLHIFSGQDEITTSGEYTFEITPLANNGASDVFTLHKASAKEIETINSNTTLTVQNNDTKIFGNKIDFTDHKAIAFYITKIEDANLQINSYGIQYQLVIKKSGSPVASLYKVQPIKVANFSADGTIYKLNITNDTWTYDGDTLALVGPESSTVTVAQIKGATAAQQSFTIGSDAIEEHSTGLYVKTSSYLFSSTEEGQSSYQIDPSTVYAGTEYEGKYNVSSHSLELYFNGTLVDAETIDCRKDGKQGGPGPTGPTGPGGNDGVSIHSNSSFYIDMQDPEGPSLHINANFNCTEDLNTVAIYWGDKSDNSDDIVLISSQLPDGMSALEYSISIPYKYITTKFNLTGSEYTDIKVDCDVDFVGADIANGWGTCTHITLFTLSRSGATDTKVIYRTGTEGYYFDTTSNHFISAFSKAENIHPQVTDDIVKEFVIGYISDGENQKLYSATDSSGEPISNNYIGGLYVEHLPAAIIYRDGTIATKPGFTLITDEISNNIRTIKLQPASIQKTTVTDAVWNSGQRENILQVGTVLCNQWILYYGLEIPAIANQDYVVSFYMRLVESVDNVQAIVRIEGCNGGSEDSNYSAGLLTTTWKRFFIKGHNDNGSPVRLVMGAVTEQDFNSVVTFELGGFQITRGSDLAPWEPYSGETMSVLLQTSKEFNSTVSQTTANTADISIIKQQAKNIEAKVNGSGLEITKEGTTFTGDVKATNFTVIDSALQQPIMELTYYNEVLHGTVSAVDITEGTPILIIYNKVDQTSYIINLTKLNNTPAGYTIYQTYTLTDAGELKSSNSIYYNEEDSYYYNRPSSTSTKVSGEYITGSESASLIYFENYYAYGEDTGVSFAVLREYTNDYNLIKDTFSEGKKEYTTDNYYKKDSNNIYTPLSEYTIDSKNILFINETCYRIIMNYGLNSTGEKTTADLMNYLRSNYAEIGCLPNPDDFTYLDQQHSDTVSFGDIITFLRNKVSDIEEFNTYINNERLNSDDDAITWQFNTSTNDYTLYK